MLQSSGLSTLSIPLPSRARALRLSTPGTITVLSFNIASAFGQVIRVALPNKLNVATAMLIPIIGVIILVSSFRGLALAATALRL